MMRVLGGLALHWRRVLALVALVALPLGARGEDPAPKGKEKVRLELREAPLKAVLEALSARVQRTVVFREEVPERVSASLSEMGCDEAFDLLLALHGYRKEVDGTRTIVTRKTAEGGTPTPSGTPGVPLAKLYVLSRLGTRDAVSGISSATGGQARVDVLPGARDLLVTATPELHDRAKSWLDAADRARPEARAFRLFNRTIAGVDSAAAAASDPIAREVSRLLSAKGTLEVDLPKNALVVTDDAAAIERVAVALAYLDRVPLSVSIVAAVLEQPIGQPLRGFAPSNDLPAAFADHGASGILVCFAQEPGPLEPFVAGLSGEELEDGETARRTQEARCDERKSVTFELPGAPPVAMTPRIATGGVDLEIKVGAFEARIRAPSGRAVAVRGIVKTEKWGGGWSDRRRELVLLVRAVADKAPPPPPPFERPRRERLPALLGPEEWSRTAAAK